MFLEQADECGNGCCNIWNVPLIHRLVLLFEVCVASEHKEVGEEVVGGGGGSGRTKVGAGVGENN